MGRKFEEKNSKSALCNEFVTFLDTFDTFAENIYNARLDILFCLILVRITFIYLF